MTGLSPAKFLASWTESSREPYGNRLARLLAAVHGSKQIAEDTVGQRNCRLLRLHRSITSRPLEGSVTCLRCSTENEFLVPARDILAAPDPLPDLRVELRVGESTVTFRLPRMKDLVANGREGVVARCRISGEGAMTNAAIERLGRKFEQFDPAANIVVHLDCSHCGRRIAATVDVATFVGREFDRFIDRLVREIDVIATAYGWSERAILALPRRRRRLYVELILGRAPVSSRAAGARA